MESLEIVMGRRINELTQKYIQDYEELSAKYLEQRRINFRVLVLSYILLFLEEILIYLTLYTTR